MPKRKKTKIVATLGPATSSKEVLKGMLDEGANVFRINFSHADYKDVEERVKMIRELNEEFGYNASILADLQGPKLRVGVMKEEVIVNPGDEIIFATGERFEGTKERVYMTYNNFPQDAKPGERILLDDGKLIFEVVSTDKKKEVVAKVIQGGPLKSKKGVNLPNTNISQPALTEKDVEDAIFACKLGVDWIALSFGNADPTCALGSGPASSPAANVETAPVLALERSQRFCVIGGCTSRHAGSDNREAGGGAKKLFRTAMRGRVEAVASCQGPKVC